MIHYIQSNVDELARDQILIEHRATNRFGSSYSCTELKYDTFIVPTAVKAIPDNKSVQKLFLRFPRYRRVLMNAIHTNDLVFGKCYHNWSYMSIYDEWKRVSFLFMPVKLDNKSSCQYAYVQDCFTDLKSRLAKKYYDLGVSKFLITLDSFLEKDDSVDADIVKDIIESQLHGVEQDCFIKYASTN